MTPAAVASNKDAAHPRVFGGRYHVLFRLGSGGMAAVYVARDASTSGLVAIKALHAHLEGEGDFERDFLREAGIARRIEHPHVVAVGEGGTEQGTPWLQLEYVDGDTLHALHKEALARGEALPTGVVVRIILDVLAGLHAAHELRQPDGTPSNLVHRDVSPQNVLLGTDGRAKLTDFGVARIAERTAMTAAGLVKGKLRYMAPEQVVNKEIDRRTDGFAAGVVAWELLANRRLYDGDDGNVIFQLVAGNLPTLASVRPELAAISEVLGKALAREPKDRFATAADFAAALEALGLAGTHEDVAQCLRHLLGPALQIRETSILHATETPPATVPGAALAEPHTTTRLLVAATPKPRRRWLIVLAPLFVAGAAAAYLARPTPPPTALPAPSPDPAPAPNRAPAPDPAPTPDPPRPATLLVVSNAPLSAVDRIRGTDHAALAIPRGSVRFEAPGTEPGDVLRATALDGRHAEARVEGGATLELTFTGTPPTKPPAPTKPKGGKDGLHRNFP